MNFQQCPSGAVHEQRATICSTTAISSKLVTDVSKEHILQHVLRTVFEMFASIGTRSVDCEPSAETKEASVRTIRSILDASAIPALRRSLLVSAGCRIGHLFAILTAETDR